jgi:NAD(P)-dependent dehydrogenase (short-subunit alcohol dehydrogenase family)
MRFDDKVAIVTGAGQGIGEAYAKALAERGANVVIAEIDKSAGENVANALSESGHSAWFVETDVASAESCAALAKQTTDRFGGIDFLVNNAAIFGGKRKEGLLTVDYAYYQRFMEVNMNGLLIATRAVYPFMVARGGGAIVNQSSTAAWAGGDFYSVSKAATNALTVSLAREMGPMNIRVNAIAPGPTDTPATRASVPPERLEQIVRQMPLARMGTTDDIVAACLFLLSDAASWVTGQILAVDGGSVVRL